MTLSEFKSELATVHTRVYRYRATPKAQLPYIVWSEDSTADFIADNKHTETKWEGTIDLFTKTEDDPLINAVSSLLNSLPIGWRLDNVLYEEDTNIIHVVWVFRC